MEVILAALLAGIVTGTQNSVASAVQDAYTKLRDALRRRLAGQPTAQEAVEAYVKNPDVWKAKLEAQLKDAGVDNDRDILAAAALVLQHAGQGQQVVGKYVVDNAGSTGNQFGEGNTQTFNFGFPPR